VEKIIPLSEALSHDIEERVRQKFEIQLAEKEDEYQGRLKKNARSSKQSSGNKQRMS
jgi:hypothetical protein